MAMMYLVMYLVLVEMDAEGTDLRLITSHILHQVINVISFLIHVNHVDHQLNCRFHQMLLTIHHCCANLEDTSLIHVLRNSSRSMVPWVVYQGEMRK